MRKLNQNQLKNLVRILVWTIGVMSIGLLYITHEKADERIRAYDFEHHGQFKERYEILNHAEMEPHCRRFKLVYDYDSESCITLDEWNYYHVELKGE